MKYLLVFFLLTGQLLPAAAQQNWAALPCSKMKSSVSIDWMFVDSLHNELILGSINGSTICTTPYKGVVAYNGSYFNDLDKGLNVFNPNAAGGGAIILGGITYGNKTLFGGLFSSVGSDTLYAQSIALWNGAVWDTFPTHCFDVAPNSANVGGFRGFLKWNGKLWMYGAFNTIGNTVSKNIVAYDGNTFTPVPSIPVNDYGVVAQMIVYKNKLVAIGDFYNYSSSTFWRLAQYDGTSWSAVGSGILGGIDSPAEMTVYKDTLYIAGSFSKASGNAGNYIMKWDGNQLTDAGFGNFCGWGAIRSLVPFRNRLYALGTFECAVNQRAYGVAYYENGAWTVPQDSIGNYNITKAVLYNGAIYIAGGFMSINGDTTIQKIAKLVCPDFDAVAGCISSIKETNNSLGVAVFPNPTNGKLSLKFEPGFSIDKVSITNLLGQPLYQFKAPQPQQEIDISHLPAGIYFLKAESQKAQAVFKIIKE